MGRENFMKRRLTALFAAVFVALACTYTGGSPSTVYADTSEAVSGDTAGGSGTEETASQSTDTSTASDSVYQDAAVTASSGTESSSAESSSADSSSSDTVVEEETEAVSSSSGSEAEEVSVQSTSSGEDTVAEEETQAPGIEYKSYIQSAGEESDYVADGAVSGSTGLGKRLEGFYVRLTGIEEGEGSVRYSAYVQGIGWQEEKSDDSYAGTKGKSKRVEAIKINLDGEIANDYDVYYCVYIQNSGWLGWAKNGGEAGTTGYSCRVEAMKIVLVEKGASAPAQSGSTAAASINASGNSVTYKSCVQSYGGLDWKSDGEVSGTRGESKRLEALRISLSEQDVSGDITYRAYVQGTGWQDWVSDGTLAGTTGQSKRLEALQIRLTGEMAQQFDIYYSVYVQHFGWLGWAKNGASAGTSGFSLRTEAVRIKLVKKGCSAPSGNSGAAYYQYKSGNVTYMSHVQSYGNLDWVSNGEVSGTEGKNLRMEAIKIRLTDPALPGSIQYKAHVSNVGWQDWVSDGALAGTTGQSKSIEALQIRLTGDMASYYDVWYQVHVQNFGWLGWTKNGSYAGTTGFGLHVEAVRIMVVKKGSEAPGSTANPYYEYKDVNIDGAVSGRTIASFGGYSMSSSTYSAISSGISHIENQGRSTGFVMVDLVTGEGISYNPDQTFFSASTIKGPYVASLCYANPSAAKSSESTIHKILLYSDNDAYASLRNTYGSGCITQWCQKAGVRTSVGGSRYVYYSARELGKLWLQNYRFFESGSWGDTVGSWFESPEVSPIHEMLGSKYTTRTKAGWYRDDVLPAANDAGIVYAGSRPYMVTIMSNVSFDLTQLKPLISAIEQAHNEMVSE